MNDFLSNFKTLQLSARYMALMNQMIQVDTLNALMQEFLERHPPLKKLSLQDLPYLD